MDYWNEEKDFAELKGLTLESVEGLSEGSDEVRFKAGDKAFRLYHEQDCCESVSLHEVHGDVEDIIGSPILDAYESSSSDGERPGEWSDSWTWTFYRIVTNAGTVTMRWLGESNGYYSESVSFVEDPQS